MRRPLLIAVMTAVVLGLVWAVITQLSGDRPTAGGRREGPQVADSPSATPSEKSLLTDPSAKSAEEFRVIYEELQGLVTRAFNEHRPEILDEVFGPDCPETCRVSERKGVVSEMAAAQAVFEGYGPRVLFLKVIGGSSGVVLEGEPTRTVSIRLVDQQAPYSIVRPDGSVVERSEGWHPRSSSYRLYFSSAKQHWRIWKFEVEGPADEVLGPEWRQSSTDG